MNLSNLPKTPGLLALMASIAMPQEAKSETYTCWQSTVERGDGYEGDDALTRMSMHKNTFCSTGNGYNWLAQLMGQGPSFATTQCQGQDTSATATTLVNSGAPFTASALVGCIVVCDSVGTGAAHRYGVILSNTTTTLTIDQWYSFTSSSGASASTPDGASNWYSIIPNGAAAAWMAVTQTVITPAATDTSLSGEMTTLSMNRAVGTYAHSAAASTYTLIHQWTAGGGCTINGEAQFNAAYSASAGAYMPFESVEPTPPALLTGDTLTNTVTITI